METKTALEHGEGPVRVAALLGRGPNGQRIAQRVERQVLVGRAADVDIQVDDSNVSRHHAKITVVDAESAELSDLGSKNGTQVNGEAVRTVVLRPGDLVRIGPAELEFRLVTLAELAHAERAADAQRALERLTDRELEVARLVASGAKNADIARKLDITSRTVAAHLEHVFDRLNINSRTALTRFVIEAGIGVE